MILRREKKKRRLQEGKSQKKRWASCPKNCNIIALAIL